MRREELVRRINEALDAPDGLEGDLELQRLFVRDSAASDLADEMARIDRALCAWPAPARSDEGWEALATRIEQRLDEPLPAVGDPTAPPRFADAAPADETERPAPPAAAPASGTTSGEFSLAVLTGREEEHEPEAAGTDGAERLSFSDLAVVPPRVRGGIPGFIDVQSAAPPTAPARPRRAGVWVAGALAAAAAVGLAVVGGTATLSTAPDAEEVAAAPSAVAAAAEAAAEPLPHELSEAPPAEEEEAAAAQAVLEPEASAIRELPAAPMRRARRERPSGPRAGGGGAPRGAGPELGSEAPRVRREARAQTETAHDEETERARETGEGGGSAGSAEPEDLPDAPDRDSVAAALRAVQPLVEACYQEQHGVATVEITVGSSGRVRSALVTGFFAGTAEGSCIARAVRRARFPRFSQDTFLVTYPFQL